VLYTLIGLALIGMVLAFVLPKINASRDKILVEQAITSISDLDLKMNEVLKSEGNIRNVEFTIRKGALYVNAKENKIIFVLDGLNGLYSEPDVEISNGNVKIITTKGQKTNSVNLTLQYAGFTLKNGDDSDLKKYNTASVPYRLQIKSEEEKVGAESVFIVIISDVSGK
jgi:type II secretory pathway pseudopilin PulG